MGANRVAFLKNVLVRLKTITSKLFKRKMITKTAPKKCNTMEPLAKVLIWCHQGSAKRGFTSLLLNKSSAGQSARPFFSISDGLLPH